MFAGCGGGSGSGTAPPPITSLPAVRLSAQSPFTAGCDGGAATGTLYMDAEVEPSAAANPINPANVIAAWQQDRWSNGGSQGLVTAASFDGGRTWARALPAVAHCSGGAAANGADYERASDPWVTFAADGTAYVLSLSFTGATLGVGSSSAMLVARSSDGGMTWGPPTAVISDGSSFFNDKGSITADSTDANFVYVVWDRLSADNSGPTYFARTHDGGTSWEPARAIYDPGTANQTIGNLLLSLQDGTLLVLFTELDATATTTTGAVRIIRSTDRGVTWSSPVTIASETSAGLSDPDTGVPVRDGSDLPSATVDRSGDVYVVWQDSRFWNGQRDGIALSRSLDAGLTWSAPARVNGSAAAAFTPNVQILADGTIGVTYYDIRNNVQGSGSFRADYWLATSLDGVNWTDTHVSGPFPLSDAPIAEGLFLGDYEALTTSGADFLPVFVTAAPDTNNRTDVFAAFAPGRSGAGMAAQRMP